MVFLAGRSSHDSAFDSIVHGGPFVNRFRAVPGEAALYKVTKLLKSSENYQIRLAFTRKKRYNIQSTIQAQVNQQ